MTYQERLSPWTIIRTLPNQQQTIVSRFRRRSDAEGHSRILQQMMPNAQFAIVFDSPKHALIKDAVRS